jgi:hypothetical protein
MDDKKWYDLNIISERKHLGLVERTQKAMI